MSKRLLAVVYGATMLLGSAAIAWAAPPPPSVVPEPGVSAMLAGGAVATALFVFRNRARRR